jgi:hypothetical protein
MQDWLSRLADPPAFRAFLRHIRSRDFRIALGLCLPALIVAVLVRGGLMAFMPAAFVHNDTSSIVETASDLLTRGVFAIDSKKTFLAPLLYCVPALLHIPILPFLAVVQHLLGLVTIILGGLLVYAWFGHWRWLIVPVTLFLAVDPVLLWYEHVALPETFAVFGVLLVALASTAFYRIPNRYTFAALLLAVLFMAGARPEGRLFALFAVILVARVLWGRWQAWRLGVAISLVWTVLLFSLTRTHQSGLLLLTSVLHLSPTHLSLSPGVAENLSSLADQARIDWTKPNPPKLVALRKEISNRLRAQTGLKDIDPVCRRAGLEIALRNLGTLPDLALHKFVVAHRELPSSEFNDYAIAGQLDALYGNGDEQKNLQDARFLWGREFASQADARAYLEQAYRPVPGDILTKWLHDYVTASIASIAPLRLPGSSASEVPIQGLPWLYTFAVFGMLALALRDPRPLNVHQLWGLFLIGLWLLIMVTANIRARFRVLFEPLWIIYAFAMLDSFLILIARLRPRARAPRSA